MLTLGLFGPGLDLACQAGARRQHQARQVRVELGDDQGRRRQDELVEAIRDSDVHILGPNTNLNAFELFEDLPRRLVPGAVTSPEPVGPAPGGGGSEVAETGWRETGGRERRRREGRGPNMNGLIFLGGFFFVLWGIPSIASGSTGALIGWAIFMVVFMVPAVTVATVQGIRRREENRREIEE